MNDFDGQKTEDLIKQMLNSRCQHGYSARKRCPRCSGQFGKTKVSPRKRTSIYERDADQP